MNEKKRTAEEVANALIMDVFMEFDPVDQEAFMSLHADKANELQGKLKDALLSYHEQQSADLVEALAQMTGTHGEPCQSMRVGFNGCDALRNAKEVLARHRAKRLESRPRQGEGG